MGTRTQSPGDSHRRESQMLSDEMKGKQLNDIEKAKMDKEKMKRNPSITNKGDNDEKDESMFDNMDPDKLDWRQIFLQEKMHGEPQSIPQSIIYELVNETINKDSLNVSCPKGGKAIAWYITLIPLTHTQYITIPDPLSKRNANYYPLTLFMSIIWIFIYAYIIVWFTYDISMALGLRFSMIPMFIYPIGVSIRDVKKFKDFEIALQVFKSELGDQLCISLAETYSPQIFQMTGLSGFAWFIFILANDRQVQFQNESIQYQIPILIGVVTIKYTILLYNGFKTHKSLYKFNIYGYIFFLAVVLVIEYKNQLITLFTNF